MSSYLVSLQLWAKTWTQTLAFKKIITRTEVILHCKLKGGERTSFVVTAHRWCLTWLGQPHRLNCASVMAGSQPHHGRIKPLLLPWTSQTQTPDQMPHASPWMWVPAYGREQEFMARTRVEGREELSHRFHQRPGFQQIRSSLQPLHQHLYVHSVIVLSKNK